MTSPNTASKAEKAKHTPGDWLVAGAATIYALNGDGENRFYANVGPGFLDGRVRTPDAELEANARLISSAPDLLEVCVLAAKTFGNVSSPVVDRLRAAIAKATGGVA